MLLSTTLVSATAWLYARMYEVFFQVNQRYHGYFLVLLIPLCVSAPLAGWLADVKLGNYPVFRITVTNRNHCSPSLNSEQCILHAVYD